MKKLILLIITFNVINTTYSQTNSRCDSLEKLVDSFCLRKNDYIGKPLSKLIKDLKVKVSFSQPDNAGNYTSGMKYYKQITMFLECIDGFEIEIANKVYVDLYQLRTTDDAIMNRRLRTLLGKEIVLGLEKF